MNVQSHYFNDENVVLRNPLKSGLPRVPITKQGLSNAQPLGSRAPLGNISNFTQHVPQQPTVTKHATKLPSSRMVISPEKTSAFFKEVQRKAPSSPGIDKMDLQKNDPQLVSEIAAEITEHFRSIETKYMASPTYMERQTDITHTMRTILIDWLVDVHHKFQFQPETLFLAINIIDRFLSKKSVARNKLQLVGITAMLIAAKYEEIYVPEVKEFVHVSADAYIKDEVLRMERVILSSLDFNVTVATVYPFLKRYLRCGSCNPQAQFMAFYLSELAMMEYDSLKYSPSTIACAAIYLANKLNAVSEGREHEGWNNTLEYYTNKSDTDLRECVDFLFECLRKVGNSKLTAIRKKYCSQRRGEVAKVVAVVLKSYSA